MVLIIEKIIKSSEGYNCTIKPYIKDNKLVIPKGTYVANKIELSSLVEDVFVDIPVADEVRVYEVWLTEYGIEIIFVPIVDWYIGAYKNNEGMIVEENVLFYTRFREFSKIIAPIDKIAWFVLPAGKGLSDATMFVLKVEVIEDASQNNPTN